MKLYTDRFETTLPAEVRERFRCEIPLVEKPRSIQKRDLLPDPAGKKTPWVLLAWSAIIMTLCGIFLATYCSVAEEAKKENTWPVGHVYAHSLLTSATVRATPTPVYHWPEPGAAVPIMHPEMLPSPTPVSEVRRAELQSVPVMMPYGEIVQAHHLGSVPDQESLPLTGNHTGDAYLVRGSAEFVWVNGHWIDPIIN